MCASYGLGGGPSPDDAPYGFDPMDQRENRALLEEWLEEWAGKATTTRSSTKGTNLNPIIHALSGVREIELAWWWFHVGGRPAKFTAFNSRDDALLAKWKSGFQHRALLPATWYSEGKKVWALPGNELFMMAAILSPRTLADGSTGLSYSLVTREGIGEAAAVVSERGESRMPLILPRELHDEWLSAERPGDAELLAAVQQGSAEISRAVTAEAPTLF